MESTPRDYAERVERPPSRSKGRRLGPLEIVFVVAAIACVTFVVAVEKLGHHGVNIFGDGLGYYTWARSAVLDRDLDFTNEYTLAPVHETRPDNARRTPKGLPSNKYPIGLALIELPPVAFAYGVERVLHIESERPGYGKLYHVSVIVFLSLGGLAALYAAFRRLSEQGDRAHVLLLSIAAIGATNLPEYLTRSGSYAHVANVALIGLVWMLGQRRSWRLMPSLLIGFLIGLTVAVRNTNVLVVPWMLATFYAGPSPPRVRDLGHVALGFLAAPLLQLGANYALWGSPLVEPYPGETFDWLHPRLFDSLFSSERGWLLWHPWFFVLLVLFVVTWPRRASLAERATYATCALACLGHWLVNAAWWAWTFGFSFGNRGYLALLPVLTITVGRTRLPIRRSLATYAVAALVLWNMNLWTGFLIASSVGGILDPSLVDSASWLVRR